MKMLRKFPAILLTFCLTAAALTPWAAAAGGPKLEVSSQAAPTQSVGFTGLSDRCQSLQATFTLSADTSYDFTADSTLTALPGVYATWQQSGSTVTVYVTAKTGTLTSGGALTLGTLSADDGTAFTVEKATGVKVLGSDHTETTYTTVDTSGSTGGSTSGGSDNNAGDSGNNSGGSSTVVTRPITIQSNAGGKVTASAAQAAQGKVVTLTAAPNSGYILNSLTVTDAAGKAMTLTNLGGGKYTFVMPASAVTVSASFAAQAVTPALPFADVVPGTWYYAGVQYAYEHGLMSGTGEGQFSPDLTTSRGMIVTILYRLAGSPAVSGSAAFSDVSQGDWYAAGVAWASANGVVSGYPDGTFCPNAPITREQMAAILFQYARLQGKLDVKRADLSDYADADAVSGWAQDAMSWAVAQGLISGLSADTLVPGGSTTRAQAAVILTAFSKALG